MIWKTTGIPESKSSTMAPIKLVVECWNTRKYAAGEPGGPDSEIFYEFTNFHMSKIWSKMSPNCDCGRFLEIVIAFLCSIKKSQMAHLWNYPRKMLTLWRTGTNSRAAIDNPDIFITDVFFPLIQSLEIITEKKYSHPQNKSLWGIVGDHIKAATFLIVDGVTPSKQRESIYLRRLIRRALVKMNRLMIRGKIHRFRWRYKSSIRTYEGVYFKTEQDFQIVRGTSSMRK